MRDDLKKCEFLLIRYAPDAVREEFVNIGVLLWDATGAHVRFTHDWRRVRCLDPAADLEMLQSLAEDLQAQLSHGVLDRNTLITKLQDYCSNGLQVTSPKGCLAMNPAEELESLARLYLEKRAWRGSSTREAGRGLILGKMKDAFTQAGVWKLMRKKIAAADYTRAGDPLKIDCGYRPNGVIKMFHAVSLAAEVDAAKVLAFTYPDLRDGIARAEQAKSELTAVVEPDLDRSDQAIAFAMAVLQRNDIAIATTNELPRLADAARIELHV